MGQGHTQPTHTQHIQVSGTESDSFVALNPSLPWVWFFVTGGTSISLGGINGFSPQDSWRSCKWLCEHYQQVLAVLPRNRRMIIFGPYFSLSWSTALLIKLQKTITQEKDWRKEERRESAWLQADQTFRAGWHQCPSARDSMFQLGLSGLWEVTGTVGRLGKPENTEKQVSWQGFW